MNTKNDVEVIIGGKQYTLSGYESSEYLHKIAAHINDKLTDFQKQEGYAKLDADMKHILLAINLADDFYKAQKAAEELQRENEDLEKEIFDMKHDMIAMKSQLEDKEKRMETLEKEKTDSEHKAIRLEAELDGMKSESEENEETKTENEKAGNVVIAKEFPSRKKR